jgi:hypothetical protein
VAANLDTAAITEPELFERGLLDGFTEVLPPYPGARAPLPRGGPV